MSNGRVRDQPTLVLCALPLRPGRFQDDPHPCAWGPKERGKRGWGQGPARDLVMGKGILRTAWMAVSGT